MSRLIEVKLSECGLPTTHMSVVIESYSWDLLLV